MNHIPVFPVATPEAFLEFQRATSPVAATGKPDAARAEGFLSAHPETRAFMARLRDGDLPSSFANSIYHSVNAFRFTGGAGPARDVRWSMVPEAPLRRWTRERSPRDPRASSSRRSSRASRRARCAGG